MDTHPTQPTYHDRPRRHRHKFLLTILATLLFGGLTIHLLSEITAEKDWIAYKTAAAARGEPIEWQHYVPVAPPDAENFFAAPIAQKWLPAKQPAPTKSTKELISTVNAQQRTILPTFSIKVTTESQSDPPKHPPGMRAMPISIEDLRGYPESGPDNEVNLQSLHTWFEQWNPGFDELRAAGQRPYAYLPGDYSSAPNIPIQNFVAVRTLAQACASKANINLLLGHPEEARKDFQSLEAIIHSLDTKPKTLVAAMIQVAVAGLYTTTLHDSMQAGLWPPDQLATIQPYLEKLDVLTPVYQSLMEGERISSCQILDEATTLSGAIKASRAFQGESSRVREFASALFPRGWIRRNELYIATALDTTTAALDLKTRRYHPKRAKLNNDRIIREVSEFSVNRMIASMAVPNMGRALDTTAKNQTMAQAAALACAIERYKAAKGAYPSKLTDLTPTYIQTIPRDLVDGQPIRYINNTTNYILYSLGPNERDDHGDANKDWVWMR